MYPRSLSRLLLAASAVQLSVVLLGSTAGAAPIVLVQTSDPAWYNDGIGTLLNGTSAVNGKQHFPTSGDPVHDFDATEAPDLSAASGVLGDWLNPTGPDFTASGWSGSEISVPNSWTVGHEVAVVYEFEAVAIEGLVASFGTDNGIYVWLDGVFKGGALRPGTVVPGEHVFDLGDLSLGTHYLQLVLEDHGSTNGYDVLITAEAIVVPEPAAVLLAGLGLVGLAWGGRKREPSRLPRRVGVGATHLAHCFWAGGVRS